jgi:uncharacterized circularly permuted ATP-grasp superfamily protein
MFLHDIYHKQEIIHAGIVPVSILANSQYRPEMFGVDEIVNKVTEKVRISAADLMENRQTAAC